LKFITTAKVIVLDSYESTDSDFIDISGLNSDGVTEEVKQLVLKYIDAVINNDREVILKLKYQESQPGVVADGIQFVVLKAALKDRTKVSVNFVVVRLTTNWRIYKID